MKQAKRPRLPVTPVAQRPLDPAELARVIGGELGNKEWNDDWLAPK